MNPTLIELHVPNFEPAREFYTKLGFAICWERPPEEMKGYLVLSLEDNVICFWGGNEHIFSQKYFQKFSPDVPRGVGLEIVVQVENVRSYYKQVQEKIEIIEPLHTRPWGLEDFRFVDPYGFYLRVTSKHDVRDPKYAVK